jgi:phosphoglycolate phosphatase
MKQVNTILWDWNGTLLNDRELCINSMNLLLSARHLPTLDLEKYLKVFTFPVKNYYQVLGFDFSSEPFEVPAIEFIKYYSEGLHGVNLFEDVTDILDYFRKKGFQQFILSAMEQSALIDSVHNMGIADYFTAIVGINNHYAHSKTEVARVLLEENKIQSDHALLIGDTFHDAEVALELGISNVLIARGHQCISVISKTGNPVLGSLLDLKNYFTA